MNRFRHEYKYMIDACQESILLTLAQGVLTRDPHTQENGSYFIRSLYFDDLYDSCVKENENGTDPRSKFRIRYYNQDISRIHLEKKSKVRGMTFKESCPLTEAECRMLMAGQIPPLRQDMPEMKKQLLLEMQLRGLVAKVIVSYERIPFVYTGGNVRVTFDRAISSSSEVSRFLDGDYEQRPILPAGSSILEVKWDEVMPSHIRDVLQMDQLQWTAFSKYYMCRMLHL